MSYDTSNEDQQQRERDRSNNRRIDDLESTNPWLQENMTMDDIDRQSSKFAEHFIDNHLKTSPYGMKTNKIKRDIEAFYSINDPTVLRYTVRKIAHSPKTWSSIEDYSKPDDYYIQYKRD